MSKERRRIDGIVELISRFPAVPAAGLPASIGVEQLDDCAVVPISGDLDLVIGSDFVRGEEFHLYRAGLLSREDIGYYLVAANVSDLAAMGAAPIGIVVAFRYSSEMSDRDFEEIMEGVCKACKEFSIPLLGGDTGGYTVSVLSAAAIGSCAAGRALLRSGGKAGEALFLTGDVGTAGAAIRYFVNSTKEKRCLSVQLEEELLSAWRRVKPAISQGRILVDNNLSRCAIDTSDGLKISCEQLAAASHLDVVINDGAVPISEAAKAVASACGLDPLEIGFGDSVDFRLLFSVNRSDIPRLKQIFDSYSLSLFEIGEFAVPEGPPAAYLRKLGRVFAIPGVGWLQ